jgi:stage III sporulation protein AD
MEDEIVSPMLKVAGVGLMTQVAAGICQDAGENALGKTVELCGTVLAMYAALPLLLAVLELVESMMGGLG